MVRRKHLLVVMIQYIDNIVVGASACRISTLALPLAAFAALVHGTQAREGDRRSLT